MSEWGIGTESAGSSARYDPTIGHGPSGDPLFRDAHGPEPTAVLVQDLAALTVINSGYRGVLHTVRKAVEHLTGHEAAASGVTLQSDCRGVRGAFAGAVIDLLQKGQVLRDRP